jgi:hypothetical protein
MDQWPSPVRSLSCRRMKQQPPKLPELCRSARREAAREMPSSLQYRPLLRLGFQRFEMSDGEPIGPMSAPTTCQVALSVFALVFPPEGLPGITTAAQFGHRKAGTDETTGDEAMLPKTGSPEVYASQNRRRHPRGLVRCQTAPEP